MPQEKMAWGLFRRRQMILPTWRGWLVILVMALICGFFIVRNAYSFLATNEIGRENGVCFVAAPANDPANRAGVAGIFGDGIDLRFFHREKRLLFPGNK